MGDMGQAKRRGTYEERVADAKIRKVKYERAIYDTNRAFRGKKSMAGSLLLASMLGLAADAYPPFLTRSRKRMTR